MRQAFSKKQNLQFVHNLFGIFLRFLPLHLHFDESEYIIYSEENERSLQL